MDPERSTTADFQFTIGRLMLVIAGFALLLALIRFGMVALVASAIAVCFYLLYRHVRLTPAMFLIAALAVLVAATRFGQAAVVTIGLIVACYALLHRYVLSGAPLPNRRDAIKPRFPEHLPRR
jgi:hypothetical protein